MSIWSYNHYGDESIVTGKEWCWWPSTCIYCDHQLTQLPTSSTQPWIKFCPRCGWWVVGSTEDEGDPSCHGDVVRRAWGALKNLDVVDVSIPLDDLRNYLLAKYSDRFNVHPKRFEDLVGGIFSDFGFRVRVTSYSNDRGVDVAILDGDDNAEVAIQVKRYRQSIKAEQIRSFAGALFLKDVNSGVFVTTSRFTRGAQMTADEYEDRGMSICLCDAPKLYDALELTQRPHYTDTNDPSTPFHPFLIGEQVLRIVYDDSNTIYY